MGEKVSYCTLSISLLNIDQFSQFFSPVDSVRNLLLTGMHITLVLLQHLVKYKYPKNIQYLQIDKRFNGKFFKHLA